MRRKIRFKRILVLTLILFIPINLLTTEVPQLPWSFMIGGFSVIIHDDPNLTISFEQQNRFVLLKFMTFTVVVAAYPAS